jgi:hypothetical protein
MVLFLFHAEVFIQLVHSPGVKEDQDDKDDDGTLLGKPETEISSSDGYTGQQWA